MCGSAGSTPTSSAPTTNLCAAGTPSSVEGSSDGPWSWNCYGIGSGSTDVLCSATSGAVNGVCGAANGGTTNTAPSGSNLCSSGTATSVFDESGDGSGPWSWACMGSDNTTPLGATVGCEALGPGGSGSSGNCGTPVGVAAAAAAAAGFTTCARNDDFTQTQPAGWLNCSGDNTPANWYFNNTPGATVTCGASVFQTNDPMTGTEVLDLHWLNQWAGQYSASSDNGVFLSTNSGSYPNLGTSFTFYPYGYFEITFRLQSTPDVTSWPYESEGEGVGFWTQGDDLYNTSGPLEFDFIEIFSGSEQGPDLAIWNHVGDAGTTDGEQIINGNGSPGASFDPRQYHTIGGLITGDGQTVAALCSYLDGNFMGCGSTNYSGGQPTERFPIIVGEGIACNFNSNDISCMSPSSQSLDMYIKDIRVWSCPSWQTSMCYTTPITSQP